MGRLFSIAVRPGDREPMNVVDETDISPESGVAGDYGGAPGPRQVTVVSKERWEETCKEIGADLAWTTRRANLLLDGIDLQETTGKRLRIGDLLLEITGECRPCELMDQAFEGLRAALGERWRCGVTCRVVEGATVSIGNPVRFEPS